MQSVLIRIAAGIILVILAGSSAEAHNGRGFEIEVVGNKLQAQGINAGKSDGAPAVRPYVNSIHDHWRYVASLDSAVASLPEFEVTPQVAFSSLESYSLDLEFVAAWQWASPPLMPTPGTIPSLEPLGTEETISIQTLGAPITTAAPALLQLSSSVPAAGTGDIIPAYSIDGSPHDEIHVLQFILSATPPDDSFLSIADSEPIFVLLSPDGNDPVERLHHASLYLERYLALNGVPVPEPKSIVLALLCVNSVAFLSLHDRFQRSHENG